jgi:predicted metal-binding membrane protein
LTSTALLANKIELGNSKNTGAQAAFAQASQRSIIGVSTLLFAVSALVTVLWCNSMSAMGEMRMPGDWTMSMAWMRMPGQSWPGAMASFVGMWVLMMVAMMMPSHVPMLLRYRQAVGMTGTRHAGLLTALLSVGYFSVWIGVGIVVYPLGVALAAVEMRSYALARAVPIAVGVVVLLAGALQFTSWKVRHLVYCREASDHGLRLAANTAGSWRHGIRLGFRCLFACANLTVILLVVGVMDLRAMVIVTTAITAERLVHAGEGAARGAGFVAAGAGLILIARAAALR